MNLLKVWLAALLSLVLCCQSARGGNLQTAAIGVYGDSLSWQYSLWVPLAPTFGYSVFSNGHQFNWVDQLVQSGYNFGPQVDATGNGNFYNRNDAAIGGKQSSDLPPQVSTLAPYISSGEIKLTVLEIGGNNFTAGVGNEYPVIYNNAANLSYNPLNDPSVQTFMAGLVGDITSAVNATLAENPNEHMILTTVPDLGNTPSYLGTYPVAARRAEVTAVVNAVNQQILALAAQHHFPVVDLNALGKLALTPPKLAGIQMVSGGSSSAKSMYLSDKFHPGTVANGLLANAYLMADHVAYGDTVQYISDQTIVTRAGLTPTVTGESHYDVSPYVIYNPVPEPGTWALAASGTLALVAARHRYRRAGRAM